MKTIKMAAMLLAAVFFMFCSVNVSLAFNPQPEPPGALQAHPGDQTAKPPGYEPTKPAAAGHITVTNPVIMEGSPKMMEPLDKHPPEPGTPVKIDPVDDGKPAMKGNLKMIDPDASPGGPVMNDPGEGPTPGMKSQKKMNKQMRRY